MYAALLSSQVNSSAPLVCRHDRVNPRGRACRPNGKGSGKKGVLSDVVPELFILPGFRVNVSVGV